MVSELKYKSNCTHGHNVTLQYAGSYTAQGCRLYQQAKQKDISCFQWYCRQKFIIKLCDTAYEIRLQ